MNKKGFTLMELLLVVAILAIVAAAAAPTFTSGASDALKEARKSAFLAAYQNTVTGAHMMIALAASKGYDVASKVDNNGSIELDNFTEIKNGTGNNAETLVHKFDYYAPLATRQFKNSNGDIYSLGAKVIKATTGNKLYITYKKSDTTAVGGNSIKIGDTNNQDSSTLLNAAWNAIELNQAKDIPSSN